MTTIPIIDLSPALSDDISAFKALAKEVSDVCKHHGFFYIKNHGISSAAIDSAFSASRQFFSQDDSFKLQYRVGETLRGYVPFSSSQQSKSSLGSAKNPDEFESFMIRGEPTIAKAMTSYTDPLYGPNPWPASMPEFRDICLNYNAILKNLAYRFLPLFACALDADLDYFSSSFQDPTISLRLLHYRNNPGATSADRYGIAPHTDYGFLTILAQDKIGGLEVYSLDDDKWISAPPVPGTFVVNIGDTLSRWTNNHFISTPHRVTPMAKGKERYSIPFFFHPDMAASIEVLEQYKDDDSDTLYPPISFESYLLDRLKNTYVAARSV